jgi:3-hydroxyisobutyrate dehydrogenase
MLQNLRPAARYVGNHTRFFSAVPIDINQSSKVAFIGLGNIGFPIAGQVATAYPNCHVFVRTSATTEAHAEKYGSIRASSIEDAVADSDLVITCLPDSSAVQVVVDAIQSGNRTRPGSLLLDCTSGSMRQSQEFERQLWDHGEMYYVDCAVSGGPAGARNATLTAFIGGKESAADACSDVIGRYAKKQVYLGPAGAGHATKAMNNILLATQNWAVSESMAVLKKNGVNLHQALEAINESSGRSWSSIQRMPDNILSQKFDYGFSVGLHRKDCEVAHSLMQIDGGVMTTPTLTHTRTLMNMAVNELGPDADHTQVAQLVERWNGVRLE